VSGGFGLLKLGNITSPARGFAAALDPNAGATGVGNNNAVVGRIAGGGAVGGLQDVRMQNAVRYDSPSFAGFQVQLQYGANENKSNAPARDDSSYGVGLIWASGPFLIGGTFERRNDVAAADPGGAGTLTGLGTIGGTLNGAGAAVDNEWDSYRIGGKFTFGSGTTIGAFWDRWELTKDAATGDLVGTLGDGTAFAGAQNKLERDAWVLSVAQVFGAHKILAQYGHGSEMETNSGDLPGTKARFYNIGYEYSLSKRSMVKAGWARVSNDRNAAMDFGLNQAGLTTANGTQTGADPNAFYVGLRHLF
jgi:predicted porin